MITLAKDALHERPNTFLKSLGIALLLCAMATLLLAILEITPAPAMAAAPQSAAAFPIGPADPQVAERHGRLDHSHLQSSLIDAAPNPSPAAIAAYESAQP